MKYDDEQLRAINARDGQYLVLAPPGCGKTDILSERIARAREQGISFDDMLCLTFTNRASRSMRERIRERVGEEASQVFVGNVHRFCSNFIFNHALVPENTSIIDEEDLTDILLSFDAKCFLNARGLPDKNAVKFVDDLDAYITQRDLRHPVDALYLPPEFESHYRIVQFANYDPQQVDNLHKLIRYTLLYRQYKRERNLISFSDILLIAYDALLHDDTLAYKRYPWIQVDEVQDLNALQMAIIDRLTDTSQPHTVMYLGDEQQAIFSFLGAKLGQLQRLRERCAGHILTLGTNYRSPSYLLDVYNTFAEKQLHVDAALLPHASRQTDRDKYDLILTGNPSVEEEEKRLIKMIRYYMGFEGERLAILVPTNQAADRISDQLQAQQIGHFKISGVDMFKSKSYKTLSSCFAVLANEFNAMAWARIVHGIGAVPTAERARAFMAKLKQLMMTPADLLHTQSYIARFCHDYMSREFVFFDTETTGLNVFDDDIVQIAAFKVRRGQRVEGSDFVVFLHTDKPIPERLGDIPNPLIQAYADNPHLSREEGLQQFLDYIGDCPVLGHNVNYDYRILQHNVQRTLHRQLTLSTYDSLRLIKCVCPDLKRYKLVFLLSELHLEGKNSHLADEDIAATKALVDYCYQKALPVIDQQVAFTAHPMIQGITKRLMLLAPFFERMRLLLDQPPQPQHSLADELQALHDEMVTKRLINDLRPKFDVFLQFVRVEWAPDPQQPVTLQEQIYRHANDMTASINEGDLVNSEGLISDRVFIMTVHKGKGLEFDNVIILEANDGTYPFFSVNRVLEAPYRHSNAEVAQARMEYDEDARKFYVALSRAKRRLCVSYTLLNSSGFQTNLTPFMTPIRRFFTGGEK